MTAPARRRATGRVTKTQARQLAVNVKDSDRYERIEVSPVILSVHPKQEISSYWKWGPAWEQGRWVLEMHRRFMSQAPYITAVRVRFDDSVKLVDFRRMTAPLNDAMSGLAPLSLSDNERIREALSGAAPEPPLESTVTDQLRVIMAGQSA